MGEIQKSTLSPPVVCLFPGSGSQYVGMGGYLSKRYREAEEIFSKADSILGYDMSRICFKGGMLELSRTRNCLLAIYITSVAYFAVLKSCLSAAPIWFAGHSVGEYAAITCAGALSFEEGLHLVKFRAELAEEISQSIGTGMTVVKGLALGEIENICRMHQTNGSVSIACYNSPDQAMLTGCESSIRKVEQDIHTHFPQAQLIPLAASPAFHSPLLRPAIKLRERLSQCNWGKWSCPVISNVTAAPYHSKEDAIFYLTEQLYRPVQWIKTMEFLLAQQVGAMIETGPQTILKQFYPSCPTPFFSMDNPNDRKQLLSPQTILI